MSQTIAASTLSNKTRLKVLTARQEMLDQIFEATQGRLNEIVKKEKEYIKVLANLMLEGMYLLTESKVQVRARKADKSLVQKAKEQAESEYKKSMDKECKIELDEKNALPEDRYDALSRDENKC